MARGDTVEIKRWIREHPEWNLLRVHYFGRGANAYRLEHTPTRGRFTIYDAKALPRLLSGAY